MRKCLVGVLILVLARAAAGASSAAAFTSSAKQILDATTMTALTAAASQSTVKLRRLRGCEIQSQQLQPPTLCYPAAEEDRLDSECVQRSKTALRLPMADEFTSEICRAAIENRAKDLAYATRRDASR